MDAVAYIINGKTVIIDRDWLPYVQNMMWHFNGPGYAMTHISGKTYFLHRLIMRAKKGEIVDHKNGDILDNRRYNLRVCNPTQSTWNTSKKGGSLSPFKGVSFYDIGNGRPWRSRITVNKKTRQLGRFDSEAGAAKAYDDAAKIHFGEFAKLNFPEVFHEKLEISETRYQPKKFKVSKYKGVVYIPRLKNLHWRASIQKDKKRISLKSHATEEDAARAHDRKSWELFKDPSRLNFPEEYLNNDSL